MLTEQEEGKVRDIIGAFDNGKSVTELNAATALGNNDVMEVLQGGENKKVPVSVVKESVNSDVLTDLNKRGVFNVTVSVPLTAGSYYTLSTAIAAVPTASKSLGLDLKFSTAANIWVVYRYKGSDLTGWATTTNWEHVPDAAKLSSLETDLNEKVDKYNRLLLTQSDFVTYVNGTASFVFENNSLKFESLASGAANILVIADSEFDHNNSQKVFFNSAPVSYMIIPVISDGITVYGVRFTGSACGLYKYTLATKVSSQVTSIQASLLSYNNGDVISFIIDKSWNIKFNINGVQVFDFDLSPYANSSRKPVVGLWVTAAPVSWTTSLPVISDNISVTQDWVEITDTKVNSNSNLIHNNTVLLGELNGKSKRIHFSFDDVISAFNDISINATTYTSVFDNSFFGWLKSVHNDYGTCFSCYVFYEKTSIPFNLSQCTANFANEFTSNSNWLKFGFHSKNASTTYESATTEIAKTDYEQVITQLLRITGSYDCIDRMPRIASYNGSKEAMVGFRDANCGIVGALSAQDVSLNELRHSYYFTPSQDTFMNKHCRQFDPETQLTFVKTAQIASHNAQQYNQFPNLRNDVEIFLHESELTSGMKTWILNYIIGFKSLGYVNTFQMYHAIMR